VNKYTPIGAAVKTILNIAVTIIVWLLAFQILTNYI
jgi:hypothetical protein